MCMHYQLPTNCNYYCAIMLVFLLLNIAKL